MKRSYTAVLLVVLLAGCAHSEAAQPLPPPAGELALSPKQSCADLRSLTNYDFSIEMATLIPATADAPARCRVRGLIQPEIQFEVNLPAQWNRRFFMFGNGGYAGEPMDAGNRVGQRLTAIRRGFVVADTNTGHDAATEPLGTFAVNRQKLLDYAFRSLHTTADAGKRIAEAYFGAKPTKSYYEGCSTGGRQGLILAQRFPDDFDGLIVGAPVLNFSGTMIGYTQSLQALAKNPVPYTKLTLLAEKIYAQCDEKDGLKDGLIDDPRQCQFCPSCDLPQCAEGTDKGDCFTAGQLETLQKIYEDVKSNGQRIFPGWPVGAEIAGPNGRSGWDNWIVNEKGQASIWQNFSESFFRYLAFKNPNFKFTDFDFDKDPARLEWIRNVLDATDPDLTRLQKRGGKVLMYYGWADPALNARMGVEYYESVQKQLGAGVTDFFRLFMVPGMFHCNGGVGCSNFDKLTPLMQWVEKGLAPVSLPAARIVNGKTIRTRPLCPYPQTAKYKGTGSVDEAANFECK
jgi:feruloyl esterase